MREYVTSVWDMAIRVLGEHTQRYAGEL